MTIDEADRRDLWSSLRDTIGEPEADTLMTMLPAQPLPELATRADIAAVTTTLRAEIRAETSALRAEMTDLRADLSADLEQRFAAIDRQFGELRADLARQMLVLGLMNASLMLAVLGTVLTLGFTGAFG